jgi:hypothetical protein
MKLIKLLILFLFLSLKGFSQQAVLTSSGEKVILNFLSSLGGTITGTLGVTGNTTISGTTTLTGINNTGTITNTGALINTGKLIVGASSVASASAVLEASSTTQGFLPPRMTYAQRNAISSAIAGLVVWCSNCGSSGELQVYNGTTWTNMIGGAVAPYTIGQAALGGKIAYILQPGDPGYSADVQHGLVATVADISAGAAWGCQGTTISGADGTVIGTGNQNTIDIMAGCNTAGIAAQLAGDLVQEGYSDWYLPSKDELYKLYLNRAAIGGFAGDYYWSSTENDGTGAWFLNVNLGNLNYPNLKDATSYVRAIRAF